jgi:hypothetical protein
MGPAGDVKFFVLFYQFSAILGQVTARPSVELRHLGHHFGHQECAAVINFVAGALVCK